MSDQWLNVAELHNPLDNKTLFVYRKGRSKMRIGFRTYYVDEWTESKDEAARVTKTGAYRVQSRMANEILGTQQGYFKGGWYPVKMVGSRLEDSKTLTV